MESGVQGNIQIHTYCKNVPTVEQDLVPKCSSCCLLDSEGYVSLENILATYNAPINEEHAWALCYLSAKYLETNLLSSNTSSYGYTRRLNQTPESTAELIKIRRQDGHVALDVNLVAGNDSSYEDFHRGNLGEKVITKSKLISKIALVIYQALDFGMKDDEERSLGIALENTLDRMTYSTDRNEEEFPSQRNQKTFNEHDIMRACLTRFQNCEFVNTESADLFFRQICMNLVLDTLEFSKFVRVAERASKRLHCFCCSGGSENLTRHTLTKESVTDVKEDLKTVAKIWIHVVRELRRGVTLKRLDDSVSFRSHRDFAKTPYELLMEDIRSRRYTLRKVTENSGRAGNVNERMDLHDIIMEYVKSRPKLKKSTERILKPATQTKNDPYEELMQSIRQAHQLRQVTKRSSF